MSDRLHCPGCGIPTIEGGLDTTEEELYCNRCVEELERNMSTNKPAGGAQFTPGPWYPHLAKADHCLSSSVWGAEPGNQVAVIGGKSLQTMNANATLIAAAPAMYEALQAIEARLPNPFVKYGSCP